LHLNHRVQLSGRVCVWLVQTTKYNLVTFLPRSLYEQFTRLGNVYFTLVAVLSTTDLSPVSPITCILPLAMVIGISLIKEAVEDHHRAKLDRQVRPFPSQCSRPNRIVKLCVQ